MRLDGDPSLSLLSRVLGELLRLGDMAVIDIALTVDGGPDRIVAPAAATLDEHTHAETVDNG